MPKGSMWSSVPLPQLLLNVYCSYVVIGAAAPKGAMSHYTKDYHYNELHQAMIVFLTLVQPDNLPKYALSFPVCIFITINYHHIVFNWRPLVPGLRPMRFDWRP